MNLNQWVEAFVIVEGIAFVILLLCLAYAQRDETHP